MGKGIRRNRILRILRINYKKDKSVFITYFILRLLVIVVMTSQFVNRSYDSVFMCLLTLILFLLPSFIEKRLKIDLPNVLEIIVLLFIFSAQILGEISEYYIIYPYWDTMLHTVNGFLCAAIGIAMIDILNRSERFKFNMSPAFVALVAFCFSMTIGVIWEFFEFGMDTFFRFDMQKDTVLKSISSVALHPDGKNIPVVIQVQEVIVNGERWNLGGYLDIGLIDTMMDLFVNFIGALIFSVIGYFYIKNRGKGRFARVFMPTRKKDTPAEIQAEKSLKAAPGKDNRQKGT